jgi:hypothetical protein
MKKYYTILVACSFFFFQNLNAQIISQLSFYSPLINTFDMKYTNNHLVVSQNGLLIFDVSNPENTPKLVAQTSYPGSTAYAVAVQNNYAYMAFGNNGILAVYDISNFSSPVLKGSVAIPALSFYVYGDIKLYGNYAYLSGFDSLYVVNIANPSAPVIANVIPVAHTDFTGAESMVIETNSLFVKTPFSIQVYDISAPASPSLISSINYLHAYNNQLAADTVNHRIFLSWATALKDFTGYDTYDVSDPFSATYLFSDSTTFSPGDFGVMDYSYFNNVLFTSTGGGINAFDVSSSHHFVTAFSGEDIPNASVSIQVKDSVFFNARGGGIEVLKYSATPVPVCNAPEGLRQVVNGTTAYLYWKRATGAKSYVVAYREIGTNSWKNIPTRNNVETLSGLTPGKAYTWQVKSVCGINPLQISDWSLYNVFFVKNEGLISVSPNPATNFIHVHANDAAITQFIIADLSGRPLIKTKSSGAENTISITTLQTGSYILQALDKNNAVIATSKIFKQ